MIQDLIINERIKNYVRKPLGVLIKESKLRKNLEGNVISVGDRVTLTCIKLGLTPKVAIIDHKIMRKKISADERKVLKKFGTVKMRAKNHAGGISLGAWEKVKEALDFAGAIVRLEVEGEEDLLTLAAILNAEYGDSVIYGQPKKGIVVVKVTDRKKQEIADMLIREKALEFLNSFRGTTAIVHDSDADGVSSAVMFAKFLQRKKIKAVPFVSIGATIPQNLKEQILKQKAKNLIILDLGGEARKTIREFSQKMKVLIIDHHKIFEDDFGKALYLNPTFFSVPDDYTSPTSYLSWQICKNSDWLAAVGIIADKGFTAASGFLKKVRKKYAKTNFNYLGDLLNAADAKEKVGMATQILLGAKKPQDLVKSELAVWENEVRGEINRLVKEHRKKALFIAGGKAILYEVKPKFYLRGEIANRIQELYPDKIIIIGEIENEHYAMSFRSVKSEVSFPDLIKKSIQNLEGAHGGGHAKAAGCKIRLADKERFLRMFVENLK